MDRTSNAEAGKRAMMWNLAVNSAPQHDRWVVVELPPGNALCFGRYVNGSWLNDKEQLFPAPPLKWHDLAPLRIDVLIRPQAFRLNAKAPRLA